MAKRQITIDDGSDKRRQVELNLNPVNLQPTIRSGGNYRVAVQDTPLTNSALQLASALNQGVKVYDQAVDVVQSKAKEDVASMTDEEYDVFLEDGLDPEAKSIFGYTKQYNRSLAQKYYAETMPSKLQDLSVEMHKSYYDYKTPEEFDNALNARIGGLYEEADELLGGNVFGNEANQVLKNATTTDFVTKERAKFIQNLPTRLKEMAVESIGRTFETLEIENIDKEQLFSSIDSAYKNNVGDLGNKATNDAIFSALSTKLETLITSNNTSDNLLAQEILDNIGDGKTYEGASSKKVGSQDMFATGERQLALERLETALEKKKDKAYEKAVEAIKIPLASYESEVIQAMNAGGTEEQSEEFLKSKIASINNATSEDYIPNKEERDLLTLGLQDILNNTKLFTDSYPTNFIDNTAVLKRETAASFINDVPTEYMGKESEMPNAKMIPVGVGVDYINEANFKLENLYLEAYEKAKNFGSNAEQQAELIRLEQEYVLPKMKEWTDAYWNSPTISNETAKLNEQKTLLEEATKLSPEKAKENADDPKALEAIVQDAKDVNRKEALNSKNDVRGFFFGTRFDNYVKAFNLDFLSGDDLTRNFNDIHGDFGDGKTDGNVIALTALSELDRVEKARKLASKYNVAGITSEALLSGVIPNSYQKEENEALPTGPFAVPISPMSPINTVADPMTFSEFFDKTESNFEKFPIVVDGNIQNTITSVEGYFGAKDLDMIDAFYEGPFRLIADKYYNGDLDLLMQHQRTYLQENNFIKSE